MFKWRRSQNMFTWGGHKIQSNFDGLNLSGPVQTVRENGSSSY